MTDELRACSTEPSRVQREALRIFAEIAKRGAAELAFVESELSKLDEFTQRGVRKELTRLFDAMAQLTPGESSEPILGVTLTRPSALLEPTEDI